MLSTAALPVFLIHYDAPEWCRSAVASVSRSAGVSVQVVVIDNGGRPLEIEGVDIVSSGRNAGYTGGANLALEIWASRFPAAPVAVIGSHDLHVDEQCLARLRRALDDEERFGIVGPILTSSPRSSGGDWEPRRRRQSYDDSVAGGDRPVPRAWLSGTCLMLRRSCVDVVGSFDERFGSYVEDVDYCLRARDARWTVAVVPEATAHGLGSSSVRSYDLIVENRFRLLAKREGVRGVAMGAFEAVVRLPGLLARGLIRSPRGPFLWEALAVAKGVVLAGWRARQWTTEMTS